MLNRTNNYFLKKIFIFFIFFPAFSYGAFNAKKSTTISVKSGANFVAENSIANYKGKLVKEAGGTISGNNISFNDGVFDDSGNQVKLTGNLDLTTVVEMVLDGSKTFKGKRGNVFQSLKISGANNRLEGIVQLQEDIQLQDNNTSVTCAAQGRLPCNIVLNGGKLFLEEDLHFVDDMFLTGSGLVLLNGRNLHLGSKEMTCDSSLYFDQAQDVELHANLHLNNTWTFSENSIIEGNNRILYLDDGGEIVIEKGSSLLFRNLTIQKISGNKIRCLDSNSTLSFQNVMWIQDDNYSFTTGAIEIIDNFYLKGRNTFVYQSAQTSTVWGHSKIVVDRGMTFSFDPIWNLGVSDWDEAKNFLAFEDETSVFELKGSTLHVTSTNLKLKKGTLRIKEKSYINSELDGLFHMEEGLIIGNNNLDDDMKCEISGGAIFEVSNGALSYKNIGSSAWDMLNDQSKLSIGSSGKLKLHQTLDAGSGITELQAGSILARAPGKKLLGAVHVRGSISYEVCYN